MPESDPPVIALRDIRFAPEGRAVLDGISFDASEARIGIVGRNGSGKTTLARVISGLITPDRGSLSIAGVDVARDRKAALGTVGILFQNPDHQIIFPTVEEELAFGLRQQGRSEREVTQGVQAILDRFERGHWAKAAVHRLSQGQRQLVCLMAVLAMHPRVIVLDEPFSGLDIPTARRLERLLATLAVTLVQITHDPAALKGYDRVLWLEEGRIVMDGAPERVLAAFSEAMEDMGRDDDLTDLAS